MSKGLSFACEYQDIELQKKGAVVDLLSNFCESDVYMLGDLHARELDKSCQAAVAFFHMKKAISKLSAEIT